ncbi:MAG: spore protease YyaC [Clostridia bacterium]|nr:spore protease YyaC [Clostridia bacterium]
MLRRQCECKKYKTKYYICINSTKAIEAKLKRMFSDNNTHIICIGTPKHTLDMVGPYIGSAISLKFNVDGTLHLPIHAQNIESYMEANKHILEEKNVLVIDAFISKNFLKMPKEKNIEIKPPFIVLKPGGINPGKGIGKNLPSLGDWSLCISVADNTTSFFCPTAKTIENVFKKISMVISMFENIFCNEKGRMGSYYVQKFKRGIY